MIRSILIFILFFLIYYSLKMLFRSALHAAGKGNKDIQHKGEEMVQDPQCRIYVLKERAVSRRVHGTLMYFCSEACAEQYEARNRKRS